MGQFLSVESYKVLKKLICEKASLDVGLDKVLEVVQKIVFDRIRSKT